MSCWAGAAPVWSCENSSKIKESGKKTPAQESGIGVFLFGKEALMNYLGVGWILSGVGILGAVLNVRRNRMCFPVWCVGNIGWLILGILTPEMRPQILLWTTFIVLNVWGYREWGAT